MDREVLKDRIMMLAEKDVWNEVGRVFTRDLKNFYNVTDNEIMDALQLLECRFRLWPDIEGSILIYFTEKTTHS